MKLKANNPPNDTFTHSETLAFANRAVIESHPTEDAECFTILKPETGCWESGVEWSEVEVEFLHDFTLQRLYGCCAEVQKHLNAPLRTGIHLDTRATINAMQNERTSSLSWKYENANFPSTRCDFRFILITSHIPFILFFVFLCVAVCVFTAVVEYINSPAARQGDLIVKKNFLAV